MNPHGKEIKRIFDEFGIIQVFDDGNKRTLMFGQQDEQGCILKSSPALVQYDYIRAMLLVLMFQESPKRALILGLGTGALAHCLFDAYETMHIQVIEQRKDVINLGYSHFQLPRNERLECQAADAGEFIRQPPEERFDLVFSDIYSSEGMDEQQGYDDYIDNCMNQLSADGWLVLNYWVDHKQSPVIDHIEYRFKQVWVDNIDGENWVVMASNSTETLTQNERREKSRILAKTLGFSFQKVSANFIRMV